jgi:hypothetical protein
MTNRGQSQYLRLFEGATTYQRWQNYYVNQTVTWQATSWQYFPFAVDGFVGGSSGSGNNAAIVVPATTDAVVLFEQALSGNWLCQVNMYEFSTQLTQAQPQSSQLLIGSIIGEIIRISGSFTELTITLGSSLSPVGAQVPPRKFTNALIGAPLRT